MKLLIFAGSLREGSLNKKFAKEAKRLIDEKGGHETEYLDLRDYPMPVYDEDIQNQGFPENVNKLGEKIKQADAMILSSPEYNASIPGGLKNVIDWLSRLRPMPFANKPLLLMGTSPGAYGSVRGLWQVRIPFEMCNVHVYPGMYTLPHGGEAFDENGRLKDEKTIKSVSGLLEQFLAYHA